MKLISFTSVLLYDIMFSKEFFMQQGITFDTHKAVNDLVKVGFKPEQAEALVEFEKSKDTSNLATKEDIYRIERLIKEDSAKLEKSILEQKVWSLKMMAGQVALIVALIKLF